MSKPSRKPSKQRASKAAAPLPVHSARATIKLGLIGCGSRGTAAARDCVAASEGIELHAMGDVFEDRLARSKRALRASIADAFQVRDRHCFTGLSAFERVLSTDVDLVLLATPPGFRPMMFEAAVEAGKHVFMEAPVAVCPAGVRQILAAGERAASRGLAVVAGTQRRHSPAYRETIARIHGGAIGDIVSARCSWNEGFLWSMAKTGACTDLEWQLRNWRYFTWLSGELIVERHIHNLDVINWVMGGPPTAARGVAGRRPGSDTRFGHTSDDFTVEYEYPNGARVESRCRRIEGTWREVGETIVGTSGRADPGAWIRGRTPWRFEGPRGGLRGGFALPHENLVASIRAGEAPNEARRVAESTLTAILGRMAAHSGQRVEYDWVRRDSELDLRPTDLDFEMTLQVPDVVVPGSTPLI